MPKTLDRPRTTPQIEGVNMNSLSDYAVRAHNNNITEFEEVMGVFMRDCGYDRNTAKHYTTKIHKEGKAVCFWGGKSQCEKIVGAFAKIQVYAEVVDN